VAAPKRLLEDAAEAKLKAGVETPPNVGGGLEAGAPKALEVAKEKPPAEEAGCCCCCGAPKAGVGAAPKEGVDGCPPKLKPVVEAPKAGVEEPPKLNAMQYLCEGISR
jgi:hypothetical protein